MERFRDLARRNELFSIEKEANPNKLKGTFKEKVYIDRMFKIDRTYFLHGYVS